MTQTQQPGTRGMLNIAQRVASGNMATVNKAQLILDQFGIERATDRRDLGIKLERAFELNPEAVADKLILIHPDYPVFQNHFTNGIKKVKVISSTSNDGGDMHDCGCGGHSNDGGAAANAAMTAKTPATDLFQTMMFDKMAEQRNQLAQMQTLSAKPQQSSHDPLPYVAVLSIVGLFLYFNK